MNDANVLKLPANPIRNKTYASLRSFELITLLNDNEIPKINEAIEFINNNLLLVFNFIDLNLFRIKYLKFAPSNDPAEMIKK